MCLPGIPFHLYNLKDRQLLGLYMEFRRLVGCLANVDKQQLVFLPARRSLSRLAGRGVTIRFEGTRKEGVWIWVKKRGRHSWPQSLRRQWEDLLVKTMEESSIRHEHFAKALGRAVLILSRSFAFETSCTSKSLRVHLLSQLQVNCYPWASLCAGL